MSKPRTKKPKAPPKTRWEKSADRENERRLKKAPLLVTMGVIPLVTADERERKHLQGEAIIAALEEEGEAELVLKALVLRAELEATLTPEEIAHVDAGRKALPSGTVWDLDLWSGAIKEKLAVGLPKAPTYKAKLREIDQEVLDRQRRQLPLFKSDELPAELPPPREQTVPDCPDCGWKPKGTIFSHNIHRADCPGFRAFLLGLWERCEPCKEARRQGGRACEAHLLRTRACASEGHIPVLTAHPYPHPSAPDAKHIACERCSVSLGVAEAA